MAQAREDEETEQGLTLGWEGRWSLVNFSKQTLQRA